MGYPEHMSEYLYKKMRYCLISLCLLTWKYLRMLVFFSKLEPVYIHVMIGFLSKDNTALELVERSPYLLPLYPFRWCILRPILMIVKQKMDEIHSLAFGGINNSAGKTVTKAIWNRYGKSCRTCFA